MSLMLNKGWSIYRIEGGSELLHLLIRDKYGLFDFVGTSSYTLVFSILECKISISLLSSCAHQAYQHVLGSSCQLHRFC
jgi:hypothetical protein